MRTIISLALSALLAGCGTVNSLLPSVDGFQPYIRDIKNANLLANDEAECLVDAKAYSTKFDFGTLASDAAQGATKNAAGAAVNPLVPVLGAAGAAGTDLLQSIGVLGQAQRRVFLICLHDCGQRSGAYAVMDPNL